MQFNKTTTVRKLQGLKQNLSTEIDKKIHQMRSKLVGRRKQQGNTKANAQIINMMRNKQ